MEALLLMLDTCLFVLLLLAVRRCERSRSEGGDDLGLFRYEDAPVANDGERPRA